MRLTTAPKRAKQGEPQTAIEKAQIPRETKLLAAAKGGQTIAFDELCQPYAKRLLPTIHRITRNREDAEDALQDSLLRAFLHIREFDGRSSFSTWLTRIAINSALMILRKRRKGLEVSITDDLSQGLWNITDGRPNPEKYCAQREREKILRSAVENLRPSIRRVVQLRQLQEHSMKETASVLDISLAAAKARLFHARAALRKSALLKRIAQTSSEPAA